MKKLLYILLLTPLALFGQELDSCYSVNDIYQEIEDSNPPITLVLLSGWNIIGYSCIESKDALEVLSPISDKILLAKNNAGSVYMPEFGFNGIGDLLPNQGYQIKMSETVLDFEMCDYHINYHQVEGCTDCEAVNFNQWATTDDGSCTYNKCTDSSADNYQEVLPCIYYGCNDPLAANYDPYANTDDGSCVVAEACPYENYLEYSPDAISYNANLCVNIIVEGCTENTALNYNPQANFDDESCEFIYGCIDQEADNYNTEATTDDGSCIYYGCMDPTAGNYDETANTDDGACLIGGCMNPTAENYNPDAGIDNRSCVIYGCLLSDFPNYNSVANIDDGSCDMSSTDVFDCIDSLAFNFNLNANTDNGTCRYHLIVGDTANGGIVFYIDETGQHGLVAAMEDLTEGATIPEFYINYSGGYEWGCFDINVNGADGQAVGTGYHNTLDIVYQGCATRHVGITAAQAALDAEINGYTDWYTPSIDELHQMYNTIGNGGSEGNIGGFANTAYWSSSEFDSHSAWLYHFFNRDLQKFPDHKYVNYKVRVIRSF